MMNELYIRISTCKDNVEDEIVWEVESVEEVFEDFEMWEMAVCEELEKFKTKEFLIFRDDENALDWCGSIETKNKEVDEIAYEFKDFIYEMLTDSERKIADELIKKDDEIFESLLDSLLN